VAGGDEECLIDAFYHLPLLEFVDMFELFDAKKEHKISK